MSDISYDIFCKVVPKSSRREIVGWEHEALKIRLAAVPEKGKANEELIRTLADALQVPKRDIEIVSGESSRLKRVRIHGLSEQEVKLRLKHPGA